MPKLQGKIKIISLIGLFIVLAVFGVLFYLSYQKLNKEAEVRQPTKQPQAEKTVDHGEIVSTDYGPDWTDVTYEDGVHKRTLTIGSTNYKADDGSYQPVKTDIEEVKDEKSDYNYQNTANFFASYFKKDISAPSLIKLEKDGQSVDFSFVDINQSSEAKVEKNVITYPEIYPKVDARYTISYGQLLEELVIKEYTDLPKITQKMKLEGVKPEKKDDGTIELKNERTKELVWIIPAPLMYEEGNQENVNYDLHYELEQEDGAYYLSKVIDENGKNWLKSAKYPVVVDATIFTYLPGVGENKAIKYINRYRSRLFPAETFYCQQYNLCSGDHFSCGSDFCDPTCNWGVLQPANEEIRWCEEFGTDGSSGNYGKIASIGGGNELTYLGGRPGSCCTGWMGCTVWYYGYASNQINFKFKIGIEPSWMTSMKFIYWGFDFSQFGDYLNYGHAGTQAYNFHSYSYLNLRDAAGNIETHDWVEYSSTLLGNFSNYINSDGFAYMRAWRTQSITCGCVLGEKLTDYVAVEIYYNVPTPTNISFSRVKSTKVTMNWYDQIGPNPEEHHYEINRETCSSASGMNCAGTWGNFQQDLAAPLDGLATLYHPGKGYTSYSSNLANSLTPNTLYHYRVRVCMDGPCTDSSSWSSWNNVKTEVIPSPSNVYVNGIKTTSMALYWTDNNDLSNGETEECYFEIQRQKKSGAIWVNDGVPGYTTQHPNGGPMQCSSAGGGFCPTNSAQLFEGLSPNILYRYQIRALLNLSNPTNCPSPPSLPPDSSSSINSDEDNPLFSARGGGRYTLAYTVTDAPTLSSPRYDLIRIEDIKNDTRNDASNPNYGVMVEFNKQGDDYRRYIAKTVEGNNLCASLMGPFEFFYGLGSEADVVIFQQAGAWMKFTTPPPLVQPTLISCESICQGGNCQNLLTPNQKYTISIFSRNGDGCDNPASDVDDDVKCAAGIVSPDNPPLSWKGDIYTLAQNPVSPSFTDPAITDPRGGDSVSQLLMKVQDLPANDYDTTDYAVFDNNFGTAGSFVLTDQTGKHSCSDVPACCGNPYNSTCRSWGKVYYGGSDTSIYWNVFPTPPPDTLLIYHCVGSCSIGTPLESNKGYSFKTMVRNNAGAIGQCNEPFDPDICPYPMSNCQNCDGASCDPGCFSAPSTRFTLAHWPTINSVNGVSCQFETSTAYKCTISWTPYSQNQGSNVKYNIYKYFDAPPLDGPPTAVSLGCGAVFDQWRYKCVGGANNDKVCFSGADCPGGFCSNNIGWWRGSRETSTDCTDGDPNTACCEIWKRNYPSDLPGSIPINNNNPISCSGSCTYTETGIQDFGGNVWYLVTPINSDPTTAVENELGAAGFDPAPLEKPALFEHTDHVQNPSNNPNEFNINWRWSKVTNATKYWLFGYFGSDDNKPDSISSYNICEVLDTVCNLGGDKPCGCTMKTYRNKGDSGFTSLLSNTNYKAVVVAVDSINEPGLRTDPIPAASNIETPTGVGFGTIAVDSIVVNAQGSFTKLDIANSGISFQETTGHSGGGGDSGFYTSWVTGGSQSTTDFSLSPPNTQYCYQAKARNQNAVDSSDETAFKPSAPGVCKCTLANRPLRPFLQQIVEKTKFKVAIDPGDKNPHGPEPGTNDTRYTICVEEKDNQGNVLWNAYIKATDKSYNKVVGFKECEATNNPDVDYWGTRDPGWGGDNGFEIDMGSQAEYTFKIKAKNCDNIPTEFGPPATLFLIRNNIVGWVWSANTGWISLNCLNNYLDPITYGYSCDKAGDWGVNTIFESGREINPISGYAWSGAGKTKPIPEWRILGSDINVSQTANFSGYAKIAMDKLGYPNIVWIENATDIYFKKWDGKNWITLGSNPVVTGATKPSLAIDSNGNPHIVYAGGNGITYGYWDQSANGCQGAWSTAEPVGSISASANSPSIVLDKKNFPHVAWVDNDGDDEIYYNHKDETGWRTPENVSSNASESISQSLALDYSNRPHIVWSDSGSGNSDIYYKYKDENGIWQIRGSLNISIEFTGNSAVPSLALDSGGNPHVAWFDQSDGDFDVYYKYWNPTTSAWEVRGNANVSQNSYSSALLRLALDLDSSSLPHIVWSESINGNNEIFYIYYKGDSWQSVENISNNSSSSELPHFVLDNTDSPHIVWQDKPVDNKEVFYKYLNSGNDISGLGWISFNRKVCSDDPQKQCDVNCDCGAGQCIESAGTPIGFCSGNTNIECADTNTCTLVNAGFCQQGYGFCYNDKNTPADPSDDEKYGKCLDQVTPCKELTESGDCPESSPGANDNNCVYETCQTDNCPDFVYDPPVLGDENCKITSTANFNGQTNQVEGFMRVLNQKEAGEAESPPKDNWGWVKLGGQYGGLGVDESTIGLWKFNDNTDDQTTFNNDGTVYGATYTEGKFARALDFGGVDDYVSIPQAQSILQDSEFTIESWVNVIQDISMPFATLLSDFRYVNANEMYGYYFRIAGNSLQLAVRNGGGDPPSSDAFATFKELPLTDYFNKWTYVAGVFDGTYLKIYINGELKGTGENASYYVPANAPEIKVGWAHVNEGDAYFKGLIDDVRITSRALTATEIANEYISGPYVLTGTEVNSQDFFGSPDVDPNEVKLYSAFGWSWQDKVNPGYGWLEFMPAGSLIGIPWLETLYSDIYGRSGVALAPPPRTIGRYTSSYLIMSGPDSIITGIPSYYPGVYTGEPTTEYTIPSGFQTTGYPAKFSLDDITSKVTTLTTIVGGNKNKFGNEVTEYALPDDSNTNISSFNSLFVGPVASGEIRLNQKVNHFKNSNIKGNLVIDKELTFLNGDASNPFGNGTMVVDGDLIIQKNINYQKSGTCITNPSISCDSKEDCPNHETCNISSSLKSRNLASVAWFVKGNIYVDPSVSNIVGAFVAMGNEGISEGYISTGRVGKVYSISNGADDAYAWDNTAGFNYNGDNVDFGKVGSEARKSFLRWQIDIPKGAEIKKAYIRFNSYDNLNTDFKAKIGLLEDASSDFSLNPYDRLISGSEINYPTEGDLEDWLVNTYYNSADIAPLVQGFINSDSYPTQSYIGFRISGDNPPDDRYRSFEALEHAGNKPAQLIIEYSNSQKEYTVIQQADDAWAWGITAGDCIISGDCRNNNDNRFGWYDTTGGGEYRPTRSFIRFVINDLASKSEITEAKLSLTAANPAGIGSFKARIGLLPSYPLSFTTNPCSPSCPNSDGPEVAFEPGNWAANPPVYNLPEITRLVQKFVDRTNYKPGDTNYNTLGLMLRRYPNEDTAPDPAGPAYRAFTDTGAQLKIKFNSQLIINGIVIARKFNFDRKYLKGLESSEKIIYDGRVVTNTPPGLEDFTKALPDLQQVIP